MGSRICDLGENADLSLVIKKRRNKKSFKKEIKDVIHSPLKSMGIISSQWALD